MSRSVTPTDINIGIDFGVAQRLFDGRPLWTIPSKRLDEERFLSAGMLAGVFVTVVWTRRQSTIRIISVRRSRHAEKRHYRARYTTEEIEEMLRGGEDKTDWD